MADFEHDEAEEIDIFTDEEGTRCFRISIHYRSNRWLEYIYIISY